MGIDWETILGGDGADLASLYESMVADSGEYFGCDCDQDDENN